jgi:hypothetical protein
MENHLLIYVVSALSAATKEEVSHNIKRAEYFCRIVSKNGKIPIASHVYFTRFLNDKVKEERELGMVFGRELLRKCSMVEVFVVDGYVSSGMKSEIKEAEENKIPVSYIYLSSKELDFIK